METVPYFLASLRRFGRNESGDTTDYTQLNLEKYGVPSLGGYDYLHDNMIKENTSMASFNNLINGDVMDHYSKNMMENNKNMMENNIGGKNMMENNNGGDIMQTDVQIGEMETDLDSRNKEKNRKG